MIEKIINAQQSYQYRYSLEPKQSYRWPHILSHSYSRFKEQEKRYFASGDTLPSQDRIVPATVVSKGGYHSQANSIDELCKYQKEGEQFKDLVQNYMDKNGKDLVAYLHSKGKDLNNLKAVGSMKLEDNAIAALITYQIDGKKQSLMVSNGSGKGFDARVSEFAGQYLLDKDTAAEYVIVHEMMHAAGYNDEVSCEKAVGDFFKQMAKSSSGQTKGKYEQLAQTAQIRAKIQSGHAYHPGSSSKAYH